MNPRQLLDSGKLSEALRALTTEVRDNPTDVKRRTFLFELLSFSGEYDRAEKHLDVLSQENQAAAMGTLLYRAALHAEKLRQEMFAKKDYPAASAEQDPANRRSLVVNGQTVQSFVDSDPRIDNRLELFAAGSYLWIPFEHIDSIELTPPKRLRDLLWAPAIVRTGPAFRMRELGEVLLPVLSPHSWKHPDEAVRLGRATVWETDESGEAVPFGQKMFLIDDEELPLLELRTLQFTPIGATA
jgi:type VI secretion system protein ImpE